jgi:hypothetical protein
LSRSERGDANAWWRGPHPSARAGDGPVAAAAIDSFWRRARSEKARNRLIPRLSASIFVGTIATLIYLAAGELAIRTVIHAPLLEDHDFRDDRAGTAINKYIEYDIQLGWRLKPFVSQEHLHTLAYGIRANAANQTEVKPGGILAVGSSFTAGSGVDDDKTWPAFLERMTGRNVNNAGQGGHVADQIILNAEQLLPVIRPNVLVIDFATNSVLGAKYSWYGWPKPYFTVEQGSLDAHQVPVPQTPALETRRVNFSIKRLLSHVALADRFMTAFFADTWFSSESQKFIYANNDEVAVTCALLRRLQKETDKAGVRLLAVMQHSGQIITNGPAPSNEIVMVEDCIREMDIQLVDEFASLKALYDAHPDKFNELYLKGPDGSLGHKSPLGNLEVANIVKAALALPPPHRSSPEEVPAEETVKAWSSVLDVSDPMTLFQSSEIATIAASSEADGKPGELIKATGLKGEHYIATAIPQNGGTVKFSVEARAETSTQLKLQLVGILDGSAHGAIAAFDLQRLTSVPWRLGRGTDIGSGIEPIDGGWSRLWVAVTFPPGTGTDSIVVQLADRSGAYHFEPGDEAIMIRKVTIDRLEQNGSGLPRADRQN